MEPLFSEKGSYENYGIGEYLAMWGCDPCYDKAPRNYGDGYIFYNYPSEYKDENYLIIELLPAIKRQLKCKMKKNDRENFLNIQDYIKKQLKGKK